jgi:CHAD domain-containing protein
VGYRIKRRESPGETAVRIATEQTEAALSALAEPGRLGVEETIHDCRKRCRKLRGLLRLIPPDRARRARRLDRLYRDAARELAGYRDAHATLATFDRLLTGTIDAGSDRPAEAHLAAVRAELARRSGEANAAVADAAQPLERARELLAEAAVRIDGWTAADDWEAIGPGLDGTYRAGASALAELRRDPAATTSHELRKQAKYTWYHLRLLERSAPSVLVPLAGAFEAMVETLGDANDLAVLRDMVADDPEAFGGPAAAEVVERFLDRQHRQLRDAALSGAVRLYAERPRAFTRRMGAYWELWHTIGRELPVRPLPAAEAVPDLGSADGRPPVVDTEPGPDGAFAAERPSPELDDRTDQGDESESDPGHDRTDQGDESESDPGHDRTDQGDESEGEGDGLDDLTVAGLRALARAEGLAGLSRARRDRLLVELRDAGIVAPPD